MHSIRIVRNSRNPRILRIFALSTLFALLALLALFALFVYSNSSPYSHYTRLILAFSESSFGRCPAFSWLALSSLGLLVSSLPVRFSSASWNLVKRLHLRSYGKAHCGGSLCARYEQFSILTWSHSAKSSAARCFICGCSLHGRRCPRGKDVTRVSCSLSWVGWSLSWVGGSVRGVSQETCV